MALAKSTPDKELPCVYKKGRCYSNCLLCGKELINIGGFRKKKDTMSTFECNTCNVRMILCRKHKQTHGYLMKINYLEFRNLDSAERCGEKLKKLNIDYTFGKSPYNSNFTNIYLNSCLYPEDSGYNYINFVCELCSTIRYQSHNI